MYILEVCNEERDSGPCQNMVTKWFYNRESRRCEQFQYGGCGGTRNNFASQEECARFCLPSN